MLTQLTHLLSIINNFIWGLPAVILLVGTGAFLTFYLGFIQIRAFPHAFAVICGKYTKKKTPGEISHFRALMTGLSGTIGTGNIAGVATAIAMGGPGAVFWIWMSALFGMASKFCASMLAVKYREISPDGEVSGGPMYTILRGLKMPKLAMAFAVFTVIASFGIGNTVQANSVIDGLNFIVPSSATYNGFIGILLAFLVGIVIIGGIKRIGHLTAIIVPIMAIFYIGAALIVLALNFTAIPHAFHLIFEYAFNPHALGGGMVALAIKYGSARGIFSNEAGLGSTAIVHAAAKTNEPVREGLVAMLEPFFDTLIICTLTALVLLVTNTLQPHMLSTQDSTAISQQAFAQGLQPLGRYADEIGSWIVGIGIIFFAYSSMISWSYYGNRACLFAFGPRSLFFYRLFFTVAIFFGAVAPLRFVWQFADLANILMAAPNLISLWLLAPTIKAMTKDYFKRMRTRASASTL
jgi:alanine or glycine:cation symporter, AGCS family